MKKVGFIGEGESEVIILNSSKFNQYLSSLRLESVGVFDAIGGGSFRNENSKIKSFFGIFDELKAEKVFMLMDLEDDPCVTFVKDLCCKFNDKQIIIVSKKSLESWYLSDTVTLSAYLGVDCSYYKPESTNKKPYDEIKDLGNQFRIRGPGRRSHPRLANKMVKLGFSITNCLNHPNISSLRYFDSKLKSV